LLQTNVRVYIAGAVNQAATSSFFTLMPAFDTVRMVSPQFPSLAYVGGSELVAVTDLGGYPLYSTSAVINTSNYDNTSRYIAQNINNGIIINNNMSYVNKHFKNAPPLKKITNYKINGIDLDDNTQIEKLTENIIYSYKNKCLHKLIGDNIIENYKKDDLQLQSFHATDVARRKYLVKLEDSMAYLYDESSDEIDNYNPNLSEESDSSTNDDYDEIKKEYDSSPTYNVKHITDLPEEFVAQLKLV
jgi:hypothetical protein